jgi:hypothetical protein
MRENQKATVPKRPIFRGWHLILWCSRPTRRQLGGNEETVDLWDRGSAGRPGSATASRAIAAMRCLPWVRLLPMVRREHPWLVSSRQAMPVLPWRRYSIGEPVQNVALLSAFDYDTADGDNEHTAVGSSCQ